MLPTWGLTNRLLVGYLWHGSDFTRNKISRLSNENVLIGENPMKKIIVLLVVLLLLATTTQVAFANPDPPNTPPTRGACHMDVSWWAPGTGPGNAYGVQPGERGCTAFI